eukprot:1194946-Prorocentrum_minimum.AAC.2
MFGGTPNGSPVTTQEATDRVTACVTVRAGGHGCVAAAVRRGVGAVAHGGRPPGAHDGQAQHHECGDSGAAAPLHTGGQRGGHGRALRVGAPADHAPTGVAAKKKKSTKKNL